jgi:hypothetical protein
MANCTNWIIMFTRELELLNEVSDLCGYTKDGKPNISAYDLQHLSKDRNEVLLMAGRLKPAVVNLLDISVLEKHEHMDSDFDTPVRKMRYRIDFERIETELKKERLNKMLQDTGTESAREPTKGTEKNWLEETARNPFARIDWEQKGSAGDVKRAGSLWRLPKEDKESTKNATEMSKMLMELLHDDDKK